ncbi:MAG TPA: hypothetical protein VEB42_05035, partial [Chitinophagaceae bacterium]|nr:hypothetical protein [Chitinophagaceae bacterium]
LFAVVVGFFTTYINPSLKGSFAAPVIVHIHGALAFSWIMLFIFQTIAVKFRNFPLHRTLGYCGLFIASGIVLTMIPVGLFQVEKGLTQGMGDTAISQIVGVVTTAVMFAALVTAGYLYRKRPRIHKRLLLLATIVLLWPAWFRFRHYFPSVPRPDIWFAVVLADSLILLSWIIDRITYGKVHPVLLYCGLIIIAEHVFEIVMFDTALWRIWANFLYNAFA